MNQFHLLRYTSAMKISEIYEISVIDLLIKECLYIHYKRRHTDN